MEEMVAKYEAKEKTTLKQLNERLEILGEDIILKVWVFAKSESFPPTRFSMSHIFLRSDTYHHVQT